LVYRAYYTLDKTAVLVVAAMLCNSLVSTINVPKALLDLIGDALFLVKCMFEGMYWLWGKLVDFFSRVGL